MKNFLFLCISTLFLYASAWDPYTATSIEAYKESTFRALFKTNERLRTYNSVYSLLKDEQNYGLKAFEAYTKDTQRYEKAEKLFFVG